MKVAITGGHLSPAAAVIEKLKKNKKNSIIFYGRKYAFEKDTTHSFEYQVIKKENIPFKEIKSGKLKREISIDAIRSFFQIPKGTLLAYKDLKKEKPDVVLTFGGFLAFPVALAARAQNIPVVIHEQTQHAGLANRLIAKVAKKVCITFKSSAMYFPKQKTIHTGNPIREDVFKVNKKITVPKSNKIIYITGGSTGAHFINTLTQNTLRRLLDIGVVIHQTGDTELTGDYKRLIRIKDNLPENIKEKYIVKKFVTSGEIGWITQNANIVISRAGINTVLELLATKKVALLLPIRVGQKNEQLENAKYYKSTGLGEYRVENEINEDEFIETIKELIKTEGSRKKSAKIAEIKKDAAEEVVNILSSIYEAEKKKK